MSSKQKVYLCVTARPMSLLTACGELRCTATLSLERDRRMGGSKGMVNDHEKDISLTCHRTVEMSQ